MGFFSKLFRKNAKSKNNTPFEGLSEEQKLRGTMDFIRINAEDGSAEDQHLLGVMYATGKDPTGKIAFEYSPALAKQWLEKSAKQGCARAQVDLGQLYENEGNMSAALNWYQKAAAQDNVNALIEMAMAYGSGTHIQQDLKHSHELFLRAAKLDDPFAQFIVGKNYFMGNGVSENVDEAVKWYTKAAEQGESHAQFEMGQIYEYGANDLNKAKEWYQKAAAQGNEDAVERLNAL